MQLVDMHCRPCKGEHERPLSEKDALGLLKGLPGWKMMDGRLVMRYEFGSFTEAVSFLTENDFILAAKIGRAYEDFEKAGH